MTERDCLSLRALKKQVADNRCPPIEVLAVEQSMYLVFAREGGRLVRLCGAVGQALRFRSREAALAALRRIGVPRVEFVHRSVYAEMIGVEGALADTELREKINLSPEAEIGSLTPC